jgi:ABC-type iron transport system FetAB ATPase subunit
MTNLSPEQLPEIILSVRGAYHKLTLLVGPSGAGKTRLLNRVAAQLQLPAINLSLLLSQRLLSQTRQQRALKAEEVAIEIIDEHLQSGLCLDDTELLFDSALRLNPLTFLQDISRNRLIVASWNGTLSGGELRFGYSGHPDFFSQRVTGFPVISVAQDKFQLFLST